MTLYSHTYLGKPIKTLYDHLLEVGTSSAGIVNRQSCGRVMSSEALEKLSFTMGISHDFAKAIPDFQKRLLSQNPGAASSLSRHAHLSGVASALLIQESWMFDTQLPKNKAALLAYYVVTRHHRRLNKVQLSIEDLYNEKDNLARQVNSLPGDSEIFKYEFEFNGQTFNLNSLHKHFTPACFENKLNELTTLLYNEEIQIEDNDAEEFFAIVHYLFSVFIESDKRNLILGKDTGNLLLPSYALMRKTVKKSIQKQAHCSDRLVQIRNTALKEVLERVEQASVEPAKWLLSLPTGTGKTVISFLSALRLAERCTAEFGIPYKIIYALPFRSLVDQTYDVLNGLLRRIKAPLNTIIKDHALSGVPASDADDDSSDELKDWERLRFLLETWDAPIIVTTIDRLFGSFFTDRRSSLQKFHELCRSIVIVDEVQAIPSSLFPCIDWWLSKLALLGSTHSILMTATIPPIVRRQDVKIHDLVEAPQNYFGKLSRTNLFVQAKPWTKKILVKKVLEAVNKNGKNTVAVIVNTVNTCIALYENISKLSLKSKKKPRVLCLSTNLIPIERTKQLAACKELLKKRLPFILVTTQCVEAGADLDFEVIFRDFAPFSSIAQAAGRANRNDLLPGPAEVIVFKLKREDNRFDHKFVYHEMDIDMTSDLLHNKKGKRLLSESEFYSLCREYFSKAVPSKTTRPSQEIMNSFLEGDYPGLTKFEDELRPEKGRRLEVFVIDSEEAENLLKKYGEKEEDWRKQQKKRFALRPAIAGRTLSLYLLGKRKDQRYNLMDLCDERGSFLCLSAKHYQKGIGFYPDVRAAATQIISWDT